MYIPVQKISERRTAVSIEFRSSFQFNVCPDGRPPEAQNAK